MRVCSATGSATCNDRRQLLACASLTTRVGEPDAGNLHLRFDEGEQLTTAPYSTVPVVHGGGAGDDLERVRIGSAELRDQLLRHTVAEIVLLRVSREVFQG